jgi:hypothetical protein
VPQRIRDLAVERIAVLAEHKSWWVSRAGLFIDRLERAGVPYVAAFGPATYTVYEGLDWPRFHHDLDLACPSSHYAELKSLFSDIGAGVRRPSQPYLAIAHPEGDFLCEINCLPKEHRRFTHFFFCDDFLFEEMQRVDQFGLSTWVPHPEAQFALDTMRSFWRFADDAPLVVYDFAQLYNPLQQNALSWDWERLFAIIADWNARTKSAAETISRLPTATVPVSAEAVLGHDPGRAMLWLWRKANQVYDVIPESFLERVAGLVSNDPPYVSVYSEAAYKERVGVLERLRAFHCVLADVPEAEPLLFDGYDVQTCAQRVEAGWYVPVDDGCLITETTEEWVKRVPEREVS